jgi:ligand-binding sensor domain-containing protein
MGCLSGVCVVDLKSGKPFRHRGLLHKLDRPESPVIDKICCFCETKDGTLWLGSNGYGLYKRVREDKGKGTKEHFEVLTTDDGLANNAVKGIVEDGQGRLWITTDNGLSVYDPRTRTFIIIANRTDCSVSGSCHL